MKSDKVKKVILGALILVAGYVWYGNIQLLRNRKETVPISAYASVKDDNSPAALTIALRFVSPKFDPFRAARPVQETTKIPEEVTPEPLQITPRPSEIYTLVGRLGTKGREMVAMQDHEGHQQLLNTRDTIGSWRLTSVLDESAVFVSGGVADTLRMTGYSLK